MSYLNYVAINYLPEQPMYMRCIKHNFELWDGDTIVRTWQVGDHSIKCLYERFDRLIVPDHMKLKMVNEYYMDLAAWYNASESVFRSVPMTVLGVNF